jgi:peptide chain release factor 1
VKAALRQKLDSLVGRLPEIERQLAAEGATRDLDQFRRLSREHSELAGLAEIYARYRQAEADAQAAKDMAGDAAMKVFADEELKGARAAMERLEAQLQKQLLPKDPNDERNLFLEVRAGTGGDESALFAGDLFRMYTRYAERRGWPVEIISESASELGGYKEVIARISGQGAYSKLKFESGGHRVQRVPETEA